jgi:hypothetical protein
VGKERWERNIKTTGEATSRKERKPACGKGMTGDKWERKGTTGGNENRGDEWERGKGGGMCERNGR